MRYFTEERIREKFSDAEKIMIHDFTLLGGDLDCYGTKFIWGGYKFIIDQYMDGDNVVCIIARLSDDKWFAFVGDSPQEFWDKIDENIKQVKEHT